MQGGGALWYNPPMPNNANTSEFDFWYAAANTEVLLPPARRLETFGTTLLHYHLAAELPDDPGAVRVREGRIEASRPSIIIPSHLAETEMEGFSAEARRYVDFLKTQGDGMRLLQYGYRLRQESFSEQVVHDSIDSVTERIVADVKSRGPGFEAVVKGVDEPWDVCIVKLFWLEINASAPKNIMEFEKARNESARAALHPSLRSEVEQAFERASRDRSLLGELGGFLRDKGVFEQYQDRFFALLRG